MSKKPQRRAFKPDDLHLVKRAEEFHDAREPALRIGDVVRLNSGGPRMMVVDGDRERVVCAWRDDDGAVIEHDFTRAAVHRAAQV